MSLSIGVVVVTRNHGSTVGPVLRAVAEQTAPAGHVVVVDCGSDDTSWAGEWVSVPGFDVVLLGENAGFTGGNNRGWRLLEGEPDWVLFLNPDVLVPPDLLERLRGLVAEDRVSTFGALSVRLMGWDFAGSQPTGKVDSTGIFPTWKGWHDRRDAVGEARNTIEEVPALCGAFFLARVRALREAALPGDQVWDDRYFAYKEDIELSLRLRRAGWKTGIWHGAEAWHGRGWNASRRQMSREARLLSARNEVRLHATYMPWKYPASLVKWAAVAFLNL